jgi:undecaprenyl-diphosphatase
MDYIISITLGILQGITEFLPVSSSAHLVFAQHLFGLTNASQNLVMDTSLHLATALAIVIVFWKDILMLIAGPFGADKTARNQSLVYMGLIILGSIPAAIAGILFKDFFEQLFANARVTAAMLFITAAILFLTVLRKKNTGNINWLNVIIIGIAQAVAIIPGISRSGSTIAMALLLGVARQEAGRFSFMLGLVAIAGASVLQIKDIGEIGMPIGAVAAGFIASLIIGIISLKLLLNFVNQGKIHFFGFYCVVAGLLGVILLR